MHNSIINDLKTVNDALVLHIYDDLKSTVERRFRPFYS